MNEPKQPRVFIVQEPQRRTVRGIERTVDLTPAAAYGQLIVLLPPNKSPLSGAPVVNELRRALSDFGETDYLLAVGAPTFIGWATALAADANRGRVRMLIWDREARNYIEVAAQLWGNDRSARTPREILPHQL